MEEQRTSSCSSTRYWPLKEKEPSPALAARRKQGTPLVCALVVSGTPPCMTLSCLPGKSDESAELFFQGPARPSRALSTWQICYFRLGAMLELHPLSFEPSRPSHGLAVRCKLHCIFMYPCPCSLYPLHTASILCSQPHLLHPALLSH